MKKAILLFSVIFVIVFFSACGTDGQEVTEESDSIQIVTTIFPEYDWARTILGENPAEISVTQLLDSGVDMHSFQPTSEDMLKIAQCDLFIYVGGESDAWVDDALSGSQNEDMIVVNLMEAIGDQVREEEVVPGMEAEEEEEHDAEEGEEEEGPEYDEHIWLSPQNARIICGVIEEAIASADPENSDLYESNLKSYLDEIDALDKAYQKAVDSAPVKTLLFGDRFPFRYLTDAYGLDYYAAFVGCSAETEASFETIRFLAEKTDELNLSAICTIEGFDKEIAKTIIRNTKTQDQKILTMDSMQSVTAEDIENGVSWLSIMEENLNVLKEALQ